MRARALWGVFVFGALFVLLLTATQARSLPPESVFSAAASTPVWHSFQPSAWVTQAPLTCSITVYNQDGLLPYGKYSYSTDGGISWSGEIDLTPVVEPPLLPTTGTLTAANLSFPNSATPNQNQIQFAIKDNTGQWTWSGVNYVRVDGAAPTSTIGTSGCRNAGWSRDIVGTAGDPGSGVRRVEITLRDGAGLYFNGATWQVAAVWLLATGADSWSYHLPALSAGTYVVQSRATDWAGYVQSTPHQQSFTYDPNEPFSTVSTSGYLATWPGAVAGVASDATSGVASVQVAVQRASDDLWYDGLQWGPFQWVGVSGTTNWFLPLQPSLETTYSIQSRALDNCGNLQSAYGQSSFTYDATAPASVIQTSGCYSTSWTGRIEGSASDAVSGVRRVEIALRNAAGQYYNGSSWQSVPAWLTASGTISWSYLLVLGQGVYTVQSRATDWAGNTQAVLSEKTFTYDATEPQSSVGTTGNLSTWPASISGTASDATSGVSSVQVTVRRASDDLWYDGSQWGPFQWITVTGTTAWSLAIQPALETTYTVQSRATDQCGNIQTAFGQTSFVYDATAPLRPSGLVVVPAVWSKVNSFTVSWVNPPEVSGVARAHFKWDAPPIGGSDQSAGSPVSGAGVRSLSLAVPTQGSHRLYLWLEDAAGNANHQNYEATDAAAFKWDAVRPLTSISAVTGTQGCLGWYTSTVQFGLVPTDVNPDPLTINETSGISATYWRVDAGPWQPVLTGTVVITTEGAHAIEYYAEDRAGNQEAPKSVTPQVKIDSVAPTSNLPSYTGTGRNGWYTSSVSIGLSAVDATSGVSAIRYQVDAGTPQSSPGGTASVVVNEDGAHTISYRAIDLACNQEVTRTSQFKIDRTPPATSYQLDGQLGENGWFLQSPASVILSASDAVTGLQTSGLEAVWCRVDGSSWFTRSQTAFVAISGEGEHLVEYYATDRAGNAEQLRSLRTGIDLSAPGGIVPVPMVFPSGWTGSNCFDIAWDKNPLDASGIGGAYYSFSDPESATGGTLVPGDGILSLSCVQVPADLGDGAHNVYIWLRDKSGRSDHRTRQVVTVRLDRVSPSPGMAVAGSLCGAAGWYNSCITATFVATDVHSGVATGAISYQVNSAGWIAGISFSACEDRRYTLEVRAADRAGNVSSVITNFLKLDRMAPPAPAGLHVEPAIWTRNNSFALTWSNPGDLSGLAGLYYKVGSLPTSATDGIYVDGLRQSVTISASAEGELPVYVWLVDKACNVDHLNRATGMLKYDHTPPVTGHGLSGTMGADGWSRSPVQVSLNCADSGSQCFSNRYRIGDGPWLAGSPFVIAADGVITFSYYSDDSAGNVEGIHTGSLKIDQTAPSSQASADSYSRSTSFTVYWSGTDAASGITSYDVQFKEGVNGSWQDWITGAGPSQTSGLFTGGKAGKTYYFRTRARDRAGNLEVWPTTPDASVSVDSFANGNFERGDTTGWEKAWVPWPGSQVPEGCLASLVITQSYNGGSTYAVVLGCPYVRNGAPIGASMICQSIDVPSSQDMPAPTLYFRYRVFTYDMVWSQRYNRFYDSFNVGISPAGAIEPTYVFTDGNRTQEYDSLKDLGWREGTIDLKPYAGRRVKICLANVTREDVRYNTWTLVDDVRLLNVEKKLFLPAVLRITVVPSASSVDKRTRQPLPDSGAER